MTFMREDENVKRDSEERKRRERAWRTEYSRHIHRMQQECDWQEG